MNNDSSQTGNTGEGYTRTSFNAAKSKTFGKIHKKENYFAEYDLNFAALQDKPLKLLEIGVSEGGSLAMWHGYFPRAEITGLDVDPSCKQFERDGIRIYIGSQEDDALLQRISNERGPFDIVIDDGGHTMRQQIGTFRTLFPLLAEDGIFVIEDLHTSYWSEFGGRKGRGYTGIGFLKNLMDEMHYWAIRHPRVDLLHRVRNKLRQYDTVPKNLAQREVRSIYVADSIAFIRKGGNIPRNKSIKM